MYCNNSLDGSLLKFGYVENMPLLIKPTALQLYSSYFKRLVRWLPLFTPVTYLSKLLGIHAVAAFTPLELFRVYIAIILITSQKIFRF
ncbi:hypothetical protein CTV95_10345 [Pectobacterium brasiliense]|nr:hypothetical protein CTV95_10345 [Pectobacterium brasiliense]